MNIGAADLARGLKISEYLSLALADVRQVFQRQARLARRGLPDLRLPAVLQHRTGHKPGGRAGMLAQQPHHRRLNGALVAAVLINQDLRFTGFRVVVQQNPAVLVLILIFPGHTFIP
ncbi:hypothetical protein [Salmonella enterica]|uniref:hypothetical protein n=1 Tax=Salmonella enterica TaxID=28901 RepID=UPI0020CAA9A3|nr:hypothetical protein [Salmonella enterica]